MKIFNQQKMNKGMTYVELIVVLSIFSILSSVAIFSYGDFQAKVDIRNLASDIALKIVEAQKSSLSGQLPPLTQQLQINSTWKPSYGVYFTLTDNTNFIYFTDLNNPTQNSQYDVSSCPGTGECLDKITITKNNSISRLDVFYQDGTTAPLNDLTVSFSRPNSGAIIKSSISFTATVSYVQITIVSPKGATALIKLYSSGRVQIN
jgi:prepilin-type N-terminal cleavage/methylation domain-containing protein